MRINDIKKYLPLIGLGGVLLATLGFVFVNFNKEAIDFTPSTRTIAGCNVNVVSIDGTLDTNRAENHLDSLSIAQTIRSLGVDRNKKALLLLVDTPGGTAPAAEEISRALDDVGLPTATLVRGRALSGGYWVAASTDYIVSQATAVVGNIGVTSSYLEETELNQEKGYTFREIVSGEYKEVANVNKILTQEHKQYLQKRADQIFEVFAGVVKKNRNLTEEQFEKVSDGKFYVASVAEELGLIDEVGGIAEVKAYLAGRLGADPSRVLFCEPTEFFK